MGLVGETSDVECSNGHWYSKLRKWCPTCGEPTPERRDPGKVVNAGGAFLLWGVPKKLKQRFKTACFVRQTSMRREILNFMSEYAKKAGY